MNLLYFILTTYGLTFILLHGSIFEGIRPQPHPEKKWTWLFHCPLCMGFWAAAFLFGINAHTELFTFDYSLGNAFCLSCLGAGTTYLLSMIVDDFGLRVSSRTGGDYVDD